MVEIYSGTLELTKSAIGTSLTGKVLCFNNVEYTINLVYIKPEPTRQDTLTIDGLKLSIYDGAWQLMGYNEDETQYVSIAAYSDEVAGEYLTDDLAAKYCVVLTDIQRKATMSLSWLTLL